MLSVYMVNINAYFTTSNYEATCNGSGVRRTYVVVNILVSPKISESFPFHVEHARAVPVICECVWVKMYDFTLLTDSKSIHIQDRCTKL